MVKALLNKVEQDAEELKTFVDILKKKLRKFLQSWTQKVYNYKVIIQVTMMSNCELSTLISHLVTLIRYTLYTCIAIAFSSYLQYCTKRCYS